jgi:hypothetical protein
MSTFGRPDRVGVYLSGQSARTSLSTRLTTNPYPSGTAAPPSARHLHQYGIYINTATPPSTWPLPGEATKVSLGGAVPCKAPGKAEARRVVKAIEADTAKLSAPRPRGYEPASSSCPGRGKSVVGMEVCCQERQFEELHDVTSPAIRRK